MGDYVSPESLGSPEYWLLSFCVAQPTDVSVSEFSTILGNVGSSTLGLYGEIYTPCPSLHPSTELLSLPAIYNFNYPKILEINW